MLSGHGLLVDRVLEDQGISYYLLARRNAALDLLQVIWQDDRH